MLVQLCFTTTSSAHPLRRQTVLQMSESTEEDDFVGTPKRIDQALAWARFHSFDTASGVRRGADAMCEEVNGIFDLSDPTQLRWRGRFHDEENKPVESVEVFDLTLSGLLANAPEGTTAHTWASFWSHGETESSPDDVHKAIEEGWNVWRNGLGFLHPKDVERDNYAFATVLTGGEMAYVDAGHSTDGLEGMVSRRLRELASQSGGTIIVPGGDTYVSGCRRPNVTAAATKGLVKRVLKTYPMASEKERDDLVRLLHWKGRRAYVILCVAFLTPEEMEDARAKHATITSEGPAKRAAAKERRAKRAAEDGSSHRSNFKRKSLSDVTNVGSDRGNTTRGSPG